MIRYLTYLTGYLFLQAITYLITPFFPLFAVRAEGYVGNGKLWQEGWRLPKWLSWFDTPDNSLDGDKNHMSKYATYPRYFRHLIWLYRNSLYGFKWSVMAMDVEVDHQEINGELKINYKYKRWGKLTIKQPNGAWQWKYLAPISFAPNYCWNLNFGWLLDDHSKTEALFMFSPRIKRIPND